MTQSRLYIVLICLLSWIQAYAALHKTEEFGKCLAPTYSYINVVQNNTIMWGMKLVA